MVKGHTSSYGSEVWLGFAYDEVWLGKHSSLAPLCLMWCIWRERNWRTFEDRDKTDDQLLTYFSGTLFNWSRAWGLTSSDSIPMFLSSLLCN